MKRRMMFNGPKGMMKDVCANMTMEECKAMMKEMMGNSPELNDLKIDKEEESLATEELRVLFFAWLQQIEEEVEILLKENPELTSMTLADEFKLSEESCSYLLNRVKK